MKKRLISFLLALCMVAAMLPTAVTPAEAAATYSVAAAMNYAKAHWNDGKGQCAEFVSRCVIAGGINMKVKTGTGGCWKAILKATGLTKQTLKLDSKGNATKKLNGNNLAAGDVVVQWCSTHSISPHILICAGYNSRGQAIYYAHHGALNKQTYNLSVNKSNGHTLNCDMGGQVIRLSTLDPNSGNYGDADIKETTITYCRYRVTVPANYKLQCYQYPESTAKYKVINPQSSSYNITCTRKVDLSYGGTRYFFVSGDGYELYFDYVSGMSVTTLHDYTTTYVSATCTTQGYARKNCTCGYVYDTDFYGPLEHDWGDGIASKVPTCTENGIEMVICSRCERFGNREIPATGHNWTAATCTSSRSCTNCGASEGAALGHDLQNWTVTVYPTCTQEGQETASCTRCGETQSRSISVTGHKWIEATCVSPKTCTECGMTMSGALGHQYVSGTCIRCGEKDESGLLGDANGDGKVNNVDAMQILQYAVGILKAKDLNLACCNVNGDGAVNNVDAMLILQYAVGLIKHF